MKYFFILGQNPTLSSAEIAAVLEQFKIEPSSLDLSSEALVFETEKSFDLSQIFMRLGGSVKAGAIAEALLEVQPEDIVQNLKSLAQKKIYFGFSFYKLNEEISNSDFKKTCQKIKNLGMNVKKLLQELKIQARWVISKEMNLSSVVVKKNKLLTEAGAEIVFLIGKNKIYLGKTSAVQEFEELSFRDYGRPARSMRVGLMPPKLAKAMINFAKAGKTATILDPFCGFATILEEAMLWGYKNLIGSDINAETLAGAKQNLEWLAKSYKLQATGYKLLASDVRRLSEKLLPRSVDAVVTEPYLGPPLQGNEPPEKIEQIIKELSALYLDAFREFKKILKPAGKIVILLPVFHTVSGDFFMPILEEIKKIGFKAADLLPKNFEKYQFLKINPRKSIVYSRPNQKVFREIFIFRPQTNMD